MRNAIIIGLAGVVIALALWYYLQEDQATATPGCAEVKPGKFPAWDNLAIPHGDLKDIAAAYLTPAIGGTDQANGSLVGGFFKAIDVYPSMTAGGYYRSALVAWANSQEALPYWQTLQGEYVCLN